MKQLSLLKIALSILLVTTAGAIHADIVGRVTDSRQNPLKGCVVTLLAPADSSFVVAEVSGADGRFSIDVPQGRYIVNAEAHGYVSAAMEYEGGEIAIMLEDAASYLDDVTVSAYAPGSFRREANKYIYVPDAMPGEVRAGYDVLKIVPLVSVDEDGGVAVLGKGSSMIYINGKPPRMGQKAAFAMLRTVPPGSIKKVEVITNPGASVHSSFSGGIVNIIMDEPDQGLVGMMFANWRSSSNDARGTVAGPSLYMSYAHGKFNAAMTATYNYLNVDNHRETVYDYKASGTEVRNDSHEEMIGNQIGLGVTATYDFTSASKLGMAFSTSARGYRQPCSALSFDSRTGETVRFENTSREPFTRPFLSAMAFYNLETDHNGSNIDIYAWYANNTERCETDYLENGNVSMRNVLDNDSESAGAKADYNYYFTDGGSLRTGAGFTYSRTNRQETRDDIFDNFTYKDYRTFLYADYSRSWSQVFSMSAGVRGEYVRARGVQRSQSEEFSRNDWTVTPNASLSFRLPKSSQSLSLEYSYYVSYPNLNSMNPFRVWTSPTTYTTGNPLLKNSACHSISLRYALLNKLNFYMGFSRCNNTVSNYIFMDPDGNTVTSIGNFGKSNGFSFEAAYRDTFFNFMRLSATVNAYYNDVHAAINSSDVGYRGWSARQNTNIVFIIAPWNASVEISNMLWSPTKAMTMSYGWRDIVDLSITKYLFNSMSITASISNLANQWFDVSYSNSDYAYKSSNKGTAMTFSVKVTYLFGKRRVNMIEERSESFGGDVRPTL